MTFGRLERTQGPQPMSEINMTPLIDVMLVLVVIFILTVPLLTTAVKVDLPNAEGARSGTAPSAVALTIAKDGQLYLNNLTIDAAELERVLSQAAQRNRDTEVQLRADTEVAYGRVVEVMGVAQKAGLNRIGFVAKAPSFAASAAK
ncbi:MAG: biopolymer transporter ExbD [Rhodoferax sp.]|nr:biopolymer transporter ExbD [Rhodoferax sp.]